MAGIANINKLDQVREINVKSQRITLRNPNGDIETIPKKVIYTNTGKDGAYEFLGVRDKNFSVVQNETIIGVIDAAAFDKGLNLTVDQGSYYPNGLTRVDFVFPDRSYKVPGDSSSIVPGISSFNHFNGGSALKFKPFNQRLVCSNGMTMNFFDLADAVSRRHVGDIGQSEVYEMVATALDNVDKALVVIKLTSTTAANTKLTDTVINDFLDEIEKNTAKKYHEAIRNVVEDNITELGSNAWGFAQGISDFYQHHMKPSRSREVWRDEQINSVLERSGVVATVRSMSR